MKHYFGFSQPNCLMVALAACTEDARFLGHVIDTTNAGYHSVANEYGYVVLGVVGSPFAQCGARISQVVDSISFCKNIPLVAHLKSNHAVALLVDSEFVTVYDANAKEASRIRIENFPWEEVFFLEAVLPKNHGWLEVKKWKN